MTPTAGMFRWSFRWLPFFHLVLAICAAEALRLKLGSPTPATAALGLVVLIGVAALIFHTAGRYAFPLTWILIGLAVVWLCFEFLLRGSEFRCWAPAGITFCALLATYLCIPTNCGVPRYNFSQELLKPAPLDPQRLYLSVYPWAELTYCYGKQTANQSAKRYGREALRCGPDCDSSMATARSAPQVWRANLKPAFTVKLIPMSEAHLLNDQAGRDGKLALMGVDGIVVAREVEHRAPAEF